MEHIKCLRCGRRLKSEQSRELGYGEICWEKVNHSTKIYNLCNIVNNNANIDTHSKGTGRPEQRN